MTLLTKVTKIQLAVLLLLGFLTVIIFRTFKSVYRYDTIRLSDALWQKNFKSKKLCTDNCYFACTEFSFLYYNRYSSPSFGNQTDSSIRCVSTYCFNSLRLTVLNVSSVQPVVMILALGKLKCNAASSSRFIPKRLPPFSVSENSALTTISLGFQVFNTCFIPSYQALSPAR